MSRLLPFLVLLAACEASISPDAARDELMAADRAFAQATAERGTDGWVEYFAPGGRMLGGSRIITGTDSIRAVMTPAFADTSFSLTWEPRFAEASEDADLGYTVGRYESRRAGDVVGRGWYLTVWRRQSDGSWKAEMDIGSDDAS
jgi:ketosteroid isomerase-like protein